MKNWKHGLCFALALIMTAMCFVACSPVEPDGTNGSTAGTTLPQPTGTTGAPTDATTIPTEGTEPVPPTDPVLPTENTQPPTQPPVTEPAPTEPAPTEPPVVTDPPPALGSQENPASLVMGSNTAAVPGKSGYRYTWKADADGVLELEMPNSNWAFEVQNLTGGEELTVKSNSRDEAPMSFAQVSVLKGDELVIIIKTAGGNKGTVKFKATFNDVPMGTLENPYYVSPERVTGIRVPAGQSVYFAGRGYGTTMVIKNADGAVLVFDGKEYTPQKGVIRLQLKEAQGGISQPQSFAITNNSDAVKVYTVEFEIPVGTFDNPEKLEMGKHTVSIGAETMGYYYLWTAAEDGTLTIELAGSNWYYQLYNLNSYRVEEGNSREGSSNPVSMEVKAGQVVKITINTANGKAAEVELTASFA